MGTFPEMTGRERQEDTLTPEQAFERLQEWVTKHGKSLTGINAVESVREVRASR